MVNILPELRSRLQSILAYPNCFMLKAVYSDRGVNVVIGYENDEGTLFYDLYENGEKTTYTSESDLPDWIK